MAWSSRSLSNRPGRRQGRNRQRLGRFPNGIPLRNGLFFGFGRLGGRWVDDWRNRRRRGRNRVGNWWVLHCALVEPHEEARRKKHRADRHRAEEHSNKLMGRKPYLSTGRLRRITHNPPSAVAGARMLRVPPACRQAKRGTQSGSAPHLVTGVAAGGSIPFPGAGSQAANNSTGIGKTMVVLFSVPS